MEYRPVGFGSYHWAVADDDGRRLFVTVDDLGGEEGSRKAAFNSLAQAFETALTLRRQAGLEAGRPGVRGRADPLPDRSSPAAARFAVRGVGVPDGRRCGW